MIRSLLVILNLALLLIISSSNTVFPSDGDSTRLKIYNAENYPRWLKNDVYQTSQTSGITFLSKSDDGNLQFLLADDIGKIHRFFIKDDTVFSFSEIKFSTGVTEYFADFPKLDFEEIFFDKFSGDIYLTIEGNGKDHMLYHGIYILKFKDNDIYQDSVISIEKLDFKQQEVFYENLKSNIGYEGFTADENYFYLGLENVQTSEGNFSGHTVIRIADKKSLSIIKEISTENIGITTICGLYSNENFSLWGIDRNNKKVFKLIFDEYFNIAEINFFEIKTVIPRYNNFEYVGSLESITIASDKFLFMVDDPWYTYFIPPDEILNQIDKTTKDNFRKFIPVINKFEIE
ncbi:MAG: hypothetical protein OEM46_02940 [Ignavibacteria bacterium]|nr:hypothetical protein [Ignavibacteria bacterium]